jgi:hypothetical protein
VDFPAIINDRNVSSEARIAALKEFAAEGGLAKLPPPNGELSREVNNHIHTIYSFSPYTPAMAAFKAREAGLSVAGSVDHDSYAAAAEMREACAVLGLGCVTGFELRVSFKHTKFGGRKINSPDSTGLAYMTVQGIPAKAAAAVHEFLAPLVACRQKRNRAMLDALNAILAGTPTPPLSYDADVLPLSMARKGGTVTERHILYALSLALVKKHGKGKNLVLTLEHDFKITLPQKIAALLLDKQNVYYEYDLLGALKSGFAEQFYIEPSSDECIAAETVCAFARSINAFPAYAYLGDIEESPTGDKKAEKFEDGYLDELFPLLKETGYTAVTYMPPRNTLAQIERLRALCKRYGFMEISGVDINSPRQTFNCPLLLRPEFSNLIDTTWALVEHERSNAH